MLKKVTSMELKYQTILNEFLKNRDWSDQIEINSEEKLVSLATAININGHSGRLIIEASDKSDFVDVYVYYNQLCKESKINEMAILLNGIHQRWVYGHFTVFEDGYVRWSHRVDFEGSQPTWTSLERIVQPAWTATEKFADFIAAVSLTKQTAKEALDEYDRDSK
jgi:hypothetical protein